MLGIPAVLAIHFLQRKAKEIPISTLFLLEHTRRQSPGGRRFERLSNSLPLWLQILAVLLLAWLLCGPRFPRPGSVQRLAIVFDSSASMAAFKTTAIERLHPLLPKLRGQAAILEITALSATPESPRIYSGSSPEEFFTALEKNWQPVTGPLDSSHSLRLARTIASTEGIVLFITDTIPQAPPPFSAEVISVGKPLENTGMAGVSFDQENDTRIWKAIVRNYGTSPAKRSWSLVTANGSSTPREIELAPGGMLTIQSAFPAGAENVRVVLLPDDFPADDVLPLVAPAPKSLNVFTTPSPAFEPLFQRVLRSLDGITASNDAATADLHLVAYNPLDPSIATGNAVVFNLDETRSGAWMKGGIISDTHPLAAGLNWQPLLVRESVSLEARPSDIILVRQENRPLILLRSAPSGTRQLLFNFDPTLSNLEQQPAFIVLMHRFIESLRDAKIAPLAGNFETNQSVRLSLKPDIPPLVTAMDPAGSPLPAAISSGNVTTLPVAGFLTVRQDSLTLLDAAFHFGDPRESDFTACSPTTGDPASGAAALARNTVPDPFKNLWLLLLTAALIFSWHFVKQPAAAKNHPEVPSPEAI